MIYVIAFFVLLGPLVFVHELGHYLAAKLFGVRVEVFSIGFGKRLWGFKRGDTDYRLSALPFGGYVRMSGENPMEEHSGEPYEFMSHPRWQRFFIALAGPCMNVVFPLFLLAALYAVHYENPYYLTQSPAIVGWVAPNSPAAKADLETGDTIAQIDGVVNPNWEMVFDEIARAGKRPLSLKIERGAATQDKQLTLNTHSSAPEEMFGAVPAYSYVAQSVISGSAGDHAGLKAGDELVSVDDKPMLTVEELIAGMQETKGRPLTIQVRRGGGLQNLTVVPAQTGTSGYRIGVFFRPLIRVEKLSLADAWRRSFQENIKNSVIVIVTLRELLNAQVSIRQMSGPIGIAQVSGEAAQAGPYDFFRVMAMISVNLGILNLLPIPILDGGLILLLLIEGVMRRDIKREVKEMVYQAAFVFIILFAVFIIYNDITKTALGKLLHLG